MNFMGNVLLPLFLCGSVLPATLFVEALLPDVGSCSFMEYYCSARKCDAAFYKAVQKDPTGDCSIKFTKMKECVQQVIRLCTKDSSISESLIKSVVRDSHNHKVHCSDGSLNITEILPDAKGKGMPCNELFANNSRLCVETFHEMHRALNKVGLCRQQAKAKKCLKDLIDRECNYTSSEREVLEVGLADYNPFCPNNRDPDATGPDQCAVSQPTTKPTSQAAHAGTKPVTPDLSLVHIAVFGFVSYLAVEE